MSEIKDFAKVINDHDIEQNQQLREQWLRLTVEVNQVLFDLRKSSDIKFRADD